MNRYLAGAVAGTLATVPMTAVMLALFSRLPKAQKYPLPPYEITMMVTRRAGGLDRLMSQRARTFASLLAHFGYGACTGALYPYLGTENSRHPALWGGTYGVAVWVLSYLGWIPAARILRPATEHPARRNSLMIVAHLVWGAATALISQRLVGSRRPKGATAGKRSPP